MNAIFLSASVPEVRRGNYYQTADPFLIQFAVRQLVMATIHNQKIIWGGHPAITPMILAICQDLQIDYSNSVVLYQSRFFEDIFPKENLNFNNIIFTDSIPGNREMSLYLMRKAMLSRKDLNAAVFIGGMEGVELEYKLFKYFHPNAKVLLVPAAGGATRHLAIANGYDEDSLDDIDFARLFRTKLSL